MLKQFETDLVGKRLEIDSYPDGSHRGTLRGFCRGVGVVDDKDGKVIYIIECISGTYVPYSSGIMGEGPKGGPTKRGALVWLVWDWRSVMRVVTDEEAQANAYVWKPGEYAKLI